MPVPTCSTTCDVALPAIDQDDCNPQVSFSEIGRIFIAKKAAAPFNNWLAPGEWTTRISETSTSGNDYIRPITVIADKPAGTPIVRQLSNNRQITVGYDFVINFTVDDISDITYEFFRALQCGGQFRFWFETTGGKMYGGNTGFVARISGDIVLNRGVDETEVINGTIVWRTKFMPERGTSPIFQGETTIPTTFDTSLEFSAAVEDSAAGVSGTVAAIDADQLFEFNAITPQIGTPQSMSIEVATIEEITIDYTTDYTGEYFRYTDKAGVEHTGTFTNGTVSF